MGFIAYDIGFLVAFIAVLIIFLYRKRKNLKRQGLLYLYPTKVGINIIDSASSKYAKILRPLQYVVISSGYILMGVAVWMVYKLSVMYLGPTDIARQLRVPVLTPLVPYIDKLFAPGLLPPFYFTYWIIIIAVIAIPHEFAHGIFARLNKIKVHSTGFGFLGPFLAAFVEPDEKEMEKAKKFPQLSILAAGTFANILMTILFGIVLLIFFTLTFTPTGIYFNTYSQSLVNTTDITHINGIPLQDKELTFISTFNDSYVNITANGINYIVSPLILNQTFYSNLEQIIVFDDSPAFRVRLRGAIMEIGGRKISSQAELRSVLHSFRPGDKVLIKTINSAGEIKEFDVVLGEKNNTAFIGIGFIPGNSAGLMGKIYSFVAKIKDPFIYYHSKLGDLGIFINDLLWWIVLINLSVAIMNMLPAGIFDGGRFFMITIWGITGSKKIAYYSFKVITWLLLALAAAMMIKWFWVII